MTTSDLPAGERVLKTRIPERRGVDGLEYGRHVTTPGCPAITKPAGSTYPMAGARQTPAVDELLGSDAAIVQAIRQELEERRP